MADEPLNDNNFEEDEREESPEKVGKAPVRKEKRQRRRQQSWSSQDSGQSAEDYKRPMTRFRPRRKVCAFCVDKVKVIDWKNIESLRRFIGSNGSIRARRKTGTCAKHQRQLAVAIKRARHLALMPFTDEHLRLTGKG